MPKKKAKKLENEGSTFNFKKVNPSGIEWSGNTKYQKLYEEVKKNIKIGDAFSFDVVTKVPPVTALKKCIRENVKGNYSIRTRYVPKKKRLYLYVEGCK